MVLFRRLLVPRHAKVDSNCYESIVCCIDKMKPIETGFVFLSTSWLRTKLHNAQLVDLEHVPYTRVVAPRLTIGSELKYNMFSYRRSNICDRWALTGTFLNGYQPFFLWAKPFFKPFWTVWRGRWTCGKQFTTLSE